MKNITLSADEKLIDDARLRARSEGVTLNEVFRKWLKSYGAPITPQRFDELMKRVDYVKLDRKYSRKELNRR